MSLELFHPFVATWFRQQIGQPSQPQELAWPAIARGENVLVTAPTGAGKTLAAFLVAINDLLQQGWSGELPDDGVQVLYVSPLKALNNDIYRNLELPLAGIQAICQEQGVACPVISRAVRTGDTPTKDRQQMLRKPPHILVTTPESLYLLLTSPKAQQMLRTVRYLILDEIHALLDSKRGAHLALSVERLAAITAKPPQRIGLSATIRPLSEAAAFLGGGESIGTEWQQRPVTIVAPEMQKTVDLHVQLPTDVSPTGDSTGSVWPSIYRQVLDLVEQHRSTLVFVNNRAVAEKTAWNINQLAGRPVARAHHGSVSRAVRLEIEQQLKDGQLPCLVATATLELGIDIGAVDLMVQIAAPKSVSRGVQRLGRAGHRPGQVSKGRIIARTRGDLLEGAVIAREMLVGNLEAMVVPENCLDVLAQQVVAMASVAEWDLPSLLKVVRGAYSYRHLPEEELIGVLRMLAGEYERQTDRLVRPRVIWDQSSQIVRGDNYSRLLALRSAGTIPDRGYYPVYLPDRTTMLGELDEGFVFEARPGDRFMLGTAAWRIELIEQNRVIVTRSGKGGTRAPYWTGEGLGRPSELGQRYGAVLREMAERLGQADWQDWLRSQVPVGKTEAAVLERYLQEQMAALGGTLAHDRQLVVEHFSDDVGDQRLMIHSPFGGRVHAGLAILLQHLAGEAWHCQVEVAHNDDGVLLNILGDASLAHNPFSLLSSETAEDTLLLVLPGTAMFSIAFRHNLARSLLLPGKQPGQRSPLWIQRMRGLEALQFALQSPDHPLIVETYRECLQSVLDVPGLLRLLRQIEAGEIKVIERRTEHPSPFSRELLFEFSWVPMYEGVLATPKRPERAPLSAQERMRLHQRRQQSGLGPVRQAALPISAWAKFLPHWQGVGDSGSGSPERLLTVIRQLSGLPLPAPWWEDFIFPSRLAGYRPEWLDQLVSTGQVIWRVLPDAKGADRLAWYPGERELGREFSRPEDTLSWAEEQVLQTLAERGASWLQQLAATTGLDSQTLLAALEQLIWRGLVVNDSFLAVRRSLTERASASVKAKARVRATAYRPEMGRFSLAVPPTPLPLEEQLLATFARYGLFMYELFRSEQFDCPWVDVYDQLQRLELTGQVERGHYLDGPSGRQFALAEAMRQLTALSRQQGDWQVLVACDPAQVYGQSANPAENGLSWTRVPGTVLVNRDGQVTLVVERYGAKVTVLPDLPVSEQVVAFGHFLTAWQAKRFWGTRRKLTLLTWQGCPAAQSAVADQLQQFGFWREMQDLVLWRKP